jgi:hypothetical protein
MNNILTDNKTLKQFNNVEFINHIMQTGHLHQVATMKIFEEGIKVILQSKPELLKQFNEHEERVRKRKDVSIAFHIPTMIQIIEEIQTAFNLKYNQQ